MLRTQATREDYKHYNERVDGSFDNARECGLSYTYGCRIGPGEHHVIRCHNCAGVLIDMPPSLMDCKPCTMGSYFCSFWEHEQHVTDGRCGHCGAEVPIVALPAEKLARNRRDVARLSKLADAKAVRESVRP